MGSICELTIVGNPDHKSAALARLGELGRLKVTELEARWSRFRADSEISRLNASAGRPCTVSFETLLLIDHAVAGWHMSGGHFDPTVCKIMNDSGYDRSFEQFASKEYVGGHSPTSLPTAHETNAPGCSDISIDHLAMEVRFPDGVMFDPGGIGKGLAADLVVDMLLEAGALGACVNLGGDLRVGGQPPEDAAKWLIGVANPFDAQDLITVVELQDEGMSTSNRLIRQWRNGSERRNHLVQVRTGASADGIVSATIIAKTAWWSEVLTKVAMLHPERDHRRVTRRIERLRGEGLFVDEKREVRTTARFGRFDARTAITSSQHSPTSSWV